MPLIIIYTVLYALVSLLFLLEFIGRWGLKQRDGFAHREPEVRFAALIAARNEETVIAELVKSLQAQHYPRELYDIYVLVNNTTDHTAERAEAAGAIVVTCPPEVRNKGQALKYIFEQFEAEGSPYDACCIFDADNLVDPEFLQKMNDCYLAGNHAAQGCRGIRNPYTNCNTFFMVTFFGLVNHFYNETHQRLGLSVNLNGTGLMLGTDVLRRTGFDPQTMVEDMEYTAVCALYDIPIAWVRDAVVLDEQPDRLFYSLRQRRRWNYGQLQCTRLYTKALLKKRTVQSLDQCLYLLGVWHISLGYVLTMLCGAAGVVLLKLPALTLAAGCLTGYLLYLLAAVLTCLTMKRDLHRSILTVSRIPMLLTMPVYYLCWGLVAFTALILPPKTHAYIPHRGSR